MREDRYLGDIFVRHGLLSAERLEPLYELQREKGSDLIGLLVTGNIVEEDAMPLALGFVEQVLHSVFELSRGVCITEA